MKKTKEQKGITLLALIITIIVLVILAAVALNTLTNNNGIILNSQYATQEYNKSVEKEAIGKALSESKLKMYTDNILELSAELLEQQLTSAGYNVSVADGENGNFIITFNNTGNQYEVTPNGRIVGEEISVGTENNENTENGDDDDDDSNNGENGDNNQVVSEETSIAEQYGALVDEEHDTIEQNLFTFTTQEPSVGLVRHAASGTDGVVSRGDTPNATPQKGTATITGINWNYFKQTNPDDLEISVDNEPTWVDSYGTTTIGSTKYTLTVKTQAKKEEIENALRKLIVPYEVTKEVNGETRTYTVTEIDGEYLKSDVGFSIPKDTDYKIPILAAGSKSKYLGQTTTASDTSYLIIPKSVTTIGNFNLLPRDQILFASSSEVREISLKDAPIETLENHYVSTISLPNGIKTIGNKAFQNYTVLTNITIPSSVTTIGDEAFKNCNKLESITIPSGVTSIGKSAFENCAKITNITIPSGVTSIGDCAFSGCKALTSISIPSGVTSIGKGAFNGCKVLTSINIPSGVTSIGGYAFANCEVLANITIPSGVTSIENSTFEGCKALTSMNIPSGVTSIGAGAFRYCSALTGVTLPSGLTSIAELAFYGCGVLTNLTIPSGVTSIGYSAFSNCTSLTDLTIPSGVTLLDNFLFKECTSLANLTIPGGITSVGSDCFYNCSALKVVTYNNNEYRNLSTWKSAMQGNGVEIKLYTWSEKNWWGNWVDKSREPFTNVKLAND